MKPQIDEVLRKALAGFGPEGEHWTNYPEGSLTYDRRCVWGGIFDVLDFGSTGAPMNEATRWAKTLGFANSSELFRWNDAPERTFADVKDLFEKAVAKAEKTA